MLALLMRRSGDSLALAGAIFFSCAAAAALKLACPLAVQRRHRHRVATVATRVARVHRLLKRCLGCLQKFGYLLLVTSYLILEVVL